MRASRTKKKQHVTKLYRAMRLDLADLVFRYEKELHSLPAHHDEIRRRALRAAAMGSDERSPFLHASWSFEAAHRWHQLSSAHRKERPEEQILVEIDLWEWYLRCWFEVEPLRRDMIVDLSTIKQQHIFLRSS